MNEQQFKQRPYNRTAETNKYKELVLGQTYSNKYGEQFRVLERYHDAYYHVVFIETGNHQYVNARSVPLANDRSKPYIHKVGYIFTPEKPIAYFEGVENDYFAMWQNMLARCHEKQERFKRWRDVSVCKEWYNFANFYEWAKEQPFTRGERWGLDKDLFSQPDNKIYSPETCCFLPGQINSQLTGLTYDEIHKPETSPKMLRRCVHMSALLMKYDNKLPKRAADCLWRICEANGFSRDKAILAREVERLTSENNQLTIQNEKFQISIATFERQQAEQNDMLTKLALVPVLGYIDYLGKIYRIEKGKDLNAILEMIKTSVRMAATPPSK